MAYSYIPYPKWVKNDKGQDIIVATKEEHDAITVKVAKVFIKKAPIKRTRKTKKG